MVWIDAIRDLALSQEAEIVLVEGAGGLLSPLTWEATALDLAGPLSASALVVAPDRLGSLNHTLLTVLALRGAEVPVLGVVFSAPLSPDGSTGRNAAALARLRPDLRVAGLARVAGFEQAADGLGEVAAWLGES